MVRGEHDHAQMYRLRVELHNRMTASNSNLHAPASTSLSPVSRATVTRASPTCSSLLNNTHQQLLLLPPAAIKSPARATAF